MLTLAEKVTMDEISIKFA